MVFTPWDHQLVNYHSVIEMRISMICRNDQHNLWVPLSLTVPRRIWDSELRMRGISIHYSPFRFQYGKSFVILKVGTRENNRTTTKSTNLLEWSLCISCSRLWINAAVIQHQFLFPWNYNNTKSSYCRKTDLLGTEQLIHKTDWKKISFTVG